MGDFVDPQQILGARTSFCGMQTSLTTAPLTGFEDVGSTKQKRGHHLARAGFLSSRSHGTAGFILQIKTAIAHAVAVFCVVGMFYRNNQKGDRFRKNKGETVPQVSPRVGDYTNIFAGRSKGGSLPADPPFVTPMGSGVPPQDPRNGVYLKYTDIKNADVF